MPTELLIFVIGLIGCSFLTQATLGVGIICFACCCGIVQRLATSRHFEIRALEALATFKTRPPEPAPKGPKT